MVLFDGRHHRVVLLFARSGRLGECFRMRRHRFDMGGLSQSMRALELRDLGAKSIIVSAHRRNLFLLRGDPLCGVRLVLGRERAHTFVRLLFCRLHPRHLVRHLARGDRGRRESLSECGFGHLGGLSLGLGLG